MWTGGNLVWDKARGDFDPAQSNAIPPALFGKLTEEPQFLDFRKLRDEQTLSLKNSVFLDGVERLSAALRNQRLDDIRGEEVRQHRRTRRLVLWAVVLLVMLTTAALAGGIIAEINRREAERQTRVARSQLLTVQSQALRTARPRLSLLLAVEAARMTSRDHLVLPGAHANLAGALSAVRGLPFPGLRADDCILSLDGKGRWALARLPDRRIIRVDPAGMVTPLLPQASQPPGAPSVRGLTSPSGRWGIIWDAEAQAHLLSLGEAASAIAPLPLGPSGGRVQGTFFDPTERWLAITGTTASGDGLLRLYDLRTAACLAFTQTEAAGPPLRVVFAPRGAALLMQGADRNLAFWRLPGSGPPTGMRLPQSGSEDDFFTAFTFRPDALELVTGSNFGGVRLWKLKDGDNGAPQSTVLPRQVALTEPAAVTSLVYSPDGLTLVVGAADGRLELGRRSAPEAPFVWLGAYQHGLPVVNSVVSNDGRWLVSVPDVVDSPVGKFNLKNLTRFASSDAFAGLLWNLDRMNPLQGGVELPAVANAEVCFASDNAWLLIRGEEFSGRTGALSWWRLPPRGNDRSPAEAGHATDVSCFLLASDHRLLTGHRDGKIRLRSLDESGPSPPADAPGDLLWHERAVDQLALTPDGHQLLSRDEAGSAAVWQMAGGESADPDWLWRRDPPWSLNFDVAPDGSWLATWDHRHPTQLWRHNGGRADPPLQLGGDYGSAPPAVSADGRWVMAQGRVQTDTMVSPLAAGMLAHFPPGAAAPPWPPVVHALELRGQDRRSFGGSVVKAEFSADNRWLAVVIFPHAGGFWDLQRLGAGEPTLIFAEPDAAVGFSPDARWAAACRGDSTTLFNLHATGPRPTQVATVPGRGTTVLTGWSCTGAFSPDGRWLLTAGAEEETLWDLRAASPAAKGRRLTKSLGGSLHTRKFSPDGRWLLTERATELALYAVPAHSGPVEPIPAFPLPALPQRASNERGQFSPDGRLLVFPSGKDLWDLRQPVPKVHRIPLLTPLGPRLRFSPDGHWLVSVSGRENDPGEFPGRVQLLDCGNPDNVARPWTPLEVGAPVNDFTFSSDGRWFACGGEDRLVRAWDLHRPGGEPLVFAGHRQPVRTLTFAPTGPHGFELRSQDEEGTRAWLLDAQTLGEQASTRAGRSLSVAERGLYLSK